MRRYTQKFGQGNGYRFNRINRFLTLSDIYAHNHVTMEAYYEVSKRTGFAG